MLFVGSIASVPSPLPAEIPVRKPKTHCGIPRLSQHAAERDELPKCRTMQFRGRIT
jgi:hypothetical protein